MRTKRIFAVFLALMMVICTIPFSAFGADNATVLEIGGKRVALVSGFGKMNYEGKSYSTFRNFNDAVTALGTQGGTIVFTGTAKLADFQDLAGRGGLIIEGIGTKSSGNLLDFTGTTEAPVTEVNLAGNILLDFVNIRMDEGAYLLTNGYNFTTDNEFDTYHVEIYNANGSNPIEYRNPPSVAVGKSEGQLGLISIESGTFSNIASGAANGYTVNGSGFVKVTGGNITNLINGNALGTTNGNTEITVAGGKIQFLYAGSMAGTVNGNVYTYVNSGSVDYITIGPEEGATVNGNVILSLKDDAKIEKIVVGKGNVTGKKIVTINNEELASLIPEGAADYILKVSGGYVEPKISGSVLEGFFVCDKYGVPATTITVNGAAKTSENGIYQLSTGLNNVVITTGLTVAVNKNANYVAGYEDGTFRPQNNMTKAEAITLLSRILVDENVIKGKVKSNFDDVADGAWYESYIGFFEKLGYLDLITDPSGTKISPTENITRAEFVQLIYEISNSSNTSGAAKLVVIPDVDARNPFNGAVSYAMSTGIVTGYEDGSFKPDNNITRAEVVTIVNRFLGRVPTGVAGAVSFADSADHWANGQILAACNPEGVAWTANTEVKEYVLTGTTAKEYTMSLYEQGKTLSADAILRGNQVISEKLKQDIINTPNTEEIYGDKITAQKYYISEKNGNDANDGKTPETAVKTIAGLNNVVRFPRPGTAYLFERGGVYRGTVGTATNGLVIGSYGEGPKPIIMQSKKNYADPALWVETEWPNVWKCTESLYNVGVIGFDHDLQDYSADTYNETYGWIMNYNLFEFHGVQDMNKDLQFYSVLSNDPSSKVKQNDLYLYSDKGNPGSRFKSIEIGENTHIFSGKGDDVIIDNLSVKFTGGHGMGGAGGCKNRTVTNCIWSWIGGSILSLDFRGNGKPVNYGNAIEIYGSCDGYYVENNWIYQIYDTAVTHQFSDGTACIQQGVRYLGNLMEYCFWGIEFYNAPGDGKTPAASKYTKDVISAYNILNESGYGWGSTTRFRTGYAFCGSSLSKNEDQHSNYNVFNKCSGNLLNLPSNSNEMPDKNIYIQTIGCPLGYLKGVNAVCDYDAAEKIEDMWGDKNAIVIVLQPEKEEV